MISSLTLERYAQSLSTYSQYRGGCAEPCSTRSHYQTRDRVHIVGCKAARYDRTVELQHCMRASGRRLRFCRSSAHRGTGYTKALQAFRDGDAYVLSACTEYGELFTYDFLSGVLRAQRRDAHGRNIAALNVLPSERPLLVSGGDDGFVRIWDVDLQLLCEIGIGVPICDVIWANEDHLVVATSRGILGFNLCLIPPR